MALHTYVRINESARETETNGLLNLRIQTRLKTWKHKDSSRKKKHRTTLSRLQAQRTY